MRSVQTLGSAKAKRARVSPTGLAPLAPDTRAGSFSDRPSFTLPPSCPPFAPRALSRFNAAMGAPTPARLSPPNGPPCFTHTAFPAIPPPTTQRPSAASLTRYPSDRRTPEVHGSGFASSQPARRDARPKRVRHPADWPFTSRCSPPRIAATQLRPVTDRRAHVWRGLPPLGRCALAHWDRRGRAGFSPSAPIESIGLLSPRGAIRSLEGADEAAPRGVE